MNFAWFTSHIYVYMMTHWHTNNVAAATVNGEARYCFTMNLCTFHAAEKIVLSPNFPAHVHVSTKIIPEII